MNFPAHLRRYGQPLALLLGILCLALLAESNGHRLEIEWLSNVPTHLQFAWLVTGTALVALGLAAPRASEVTTHPPERPRWHVWTLTAILLLAFLLRAVSLEESVFMYVDEFGSADAVASLRANDQVPLLLPSWEIAGWSRVYAYVQTFGVDLFGANLTGLRATTVVIGTLTVWAIYLLAAQLFDRRIALLAAFWLATFPPHIHFSRLGIPNTVDPLFGTLALVLLVRAVRTGHRGDFALAGVMLGLTQYFYEAGRLLYPLVALGFAMSFVLLRRREALQSLKGIGIMALAAILVAWPGYYALAANNLSLATRFSQINTVEVYFSDLTTDSGAWLRDIFAPPFLHLVALPDTSRLYYGGDFGLILPWIVPLFLLGVVYILRRWRQPEMFMLLLWVLGVAVGNGFIEQNAYSSRYVVVLPALVLFIIAGIYTLIVRWPRHQHLIVAVSVLLAGLQVPYYFGPHLALYNQQIRPYYDFAEIIPRARDFPPGTQLHLITTDATSFWQFEVLQRYFNTSLQVDVLADLTDAYLDGLPRDVDHAFFVIPQDTLSIERIQRHFGAGAPQPSPHNVPLNRQYFMIYMPAG
jgi:hypothetical protein